MDRIDSANMASGNKFQDADPSIPRLATSLNATWCNGLQEELIKVIDEGGLTPDASDNTQVYTAIAALIATALASFASTVAYPVGSIYLTTDTTFDPHTGLGFGTWEKLPAGRYLTTYYESDDDFGTVGATGGADSYVMTLGNLIEHNHNSGVGDDTGVTAIYGNTTDDCPGAASSNINEDSGDPSRQAKTSMTGSSSPDPIPTLSPFVVIGNAWKRTA